MLPLHDPLRVAEDLAVLDLASGGRVAVTLGVGYRPEEYAAHGKSWADRGTLMDEAVATLLAAWTGEPFDYRGTTVRVTPVPRTKPHPTIMIGGSARPGARRAARFGLPFAPPRTCRSSRRTTSSSARCTARPASSCHRHRTSRSCS